MLVHVHLANILLSFLFKESRKESVGIGTSVVLIWQRLSAVHVCVTDMAAMCAVWVMEQMVGEMRGLPDGEMGSFSVITSLVRCIVYYTPFVFLHETYFDSLWDFLMASSF